MFDQKECPGENDFGSSCTGHQTNHSMHLISNQCSNQVHGTRAHVSAQIVCGHAARKLGRPFACNMC